MDPTIDLDILFAAIRNTEKLAEDEKNKHREAKRNLELSKKKLQEEEKKNKDLKAKIRALEKHLCGLQQWRVEKKIEEDLLNGKIKRLEEENQLYTKTLTVTRQENKAKKLYFMSKVKEFSEETNMLTTATVGRRQRRRETVRADLCKTKTEVVVLKQEVEETNHRLQEVKDFPRQKKALQEQLELLRHEEQSILWQIQIEETQIEQVKSDNVQLQSVPEAGEEFRQLTEDMETYDTRDLEIQANELQAQIDQTNVSLQRRESYSLQQQYRRWQRQREQLQPQPTGLFVQKAVSKRDRPGFSSITSTEAMFRSKVAAPGSRFTGPEDQHEISETELIHIGVEEAEHNKASTETEREEEQNVDHTTEPKPTTHPRDVVQNIDNTLPYQSNQRESQSDIRDVDISIDLISPSTDQSYQGSQHGSATPRHHAHTNKEESKPQGYQSKLELFVSKSPGTMHHDEEVDNPMGNSYGDVSQDFILLSSPLSTQ